MAKKMGLCKTGVRLRTAKNQAAKKYGTVSAEHFSAHRAMMAHIDGCKQCQTIYGGI